MATLTDAMVEVADCHTSLYHLGATPPAKAPFPMSDGSSYAKLYAKLAAQDAVPYADISGQSGVILKKLSPIYRKNDYWEYFFANGDVAQYPGFAWEYLVPVWCSINLHVDSALPAKFSFTVRPKPYVVLYPFGWSNCLSLRLQGSFALEDLADFNASLFTNKLFKIAASAAGQPAKAVSVRDLFTKMSEGVRADAFGGILAKDFAPKDPVIVTTIMAYRSGNLTLAGLSPSEEQAMLRIVTPTGPPPTGALSGGLVHSLQPSDKAKYVVMNDYGRFTWMEDRLVPEGRNHKHLRCNHNNTFNSLVHARHLYQLLTQVVNLSSLPASLEPLANKANDTLGLPAVYYKSASLKGFLLDPAVAAARQKMTDKFSAKKTN